MTTQRTLGQYMTPELLAQEMCLQIRRPTQEWRILDPACGDGNLLVAAATIMKRMGVADIPSRLIGIDIDPKMIRQTRQRLRQLLDCSSNALQLISADFLDIARAGKLFLTPLKGLDFNTVISNPPYGQLREYHFFQEANNLSPEGSELIFLLPLAFLDRVSGVDVRPIDGRPMGVTTGHAIIHHVTGKPFTLRQVKGLQSNSRSFKVLSGVKLYELGGGDPPQSAEILATKPYSSEIYRPGWLPCLRTGDIYPFSITPGRLWVQYGKHLAHPKDIERFTGPKVFIRRVPIWANRQLGAAYSEDLMLCAGDVLVIKQEEEDAQLLKGLCVYLNSPAAAKVILAERPSVKYRMSFPKFSGKDINVLIERSTPDDETLRKLAATYKEDTNGYS